MLTSTFALLVLVSACNKDLPDCQAHNWGTLRLLNSSSEDVRVFVDDQPFATVLSGTEIEFDHVAGGYHTVHAEQINTQRIWDNSITIVQCQRFNLAFTL